MRAVHGQTRPALGACPSLDILFHKGLKAFRLDDLQIFEHAHVILGSVTLVEPLQPGAGIFRAFIAEARFIRGNLIAVSDDAFAAVFGCGPFADSAARAGVLFS